MVAGANFVVSGVELTVAADGVAEAAEAVPGADEQPARIAIAGIIVKV
jgi:hypothetical protein